MRADRTFGLGYGSLHTGRMGWQICRVIGTAACPTLLCPLIFLFIPSNYHAPTAWSKLYTIQSIKVEVTGLL